jgi:hypothetical protein
MMPRAWLLPIGVLFALSPASGQRIQPVPLEAIGRGTEIRVWSTDPRLEGWKLDYHGATDTSLIVGERMGSARLAAFRPEIPFSNLTRLEANRGRISSPGYFASRLLIGALSGVIIGGVTGHLIDSSYPVNEGMATLVLGTIGLTSGTIIGGAVGLYGRPSWEPVDFARPVRRFSP